MIRPDLTDLGAGPSPSRTFMLNFFRESVMVANSRRPGQRTGQDKCERDELSDGRLQVRIFMPASVLSRYSYNIDSVIREMMPSWGDPTSSKTERGGVASALPPCQIPSSELKRPAAHF